MKIVISCGDINGIGLECLFKALIMLSEDVYSTNNTKLDDVSFSIVIHPNSLREYVQNCGSYSVEVSGNQSLIIGNVRVDILPIDDYAPNQFGSATIEAGRLSITSLKKAIELTLRREFDVLLTLPVSKHTMSLAGWSYPGQTEMIADMCANYYSHTTSELSPLMMLCADSLRVALATIHAPLQSVPKLLSSQHIISITELFHHSLMNDFGCSKPRIAVLGLNPHAGEKGNIGNEEIQIIEPAIQQLRQQGLDIQGCFPADGFFAHGDFKNFDGVLAMYHDQGLIPVKMLATGGGVNYTAGLPIVRTSPDHGTAYSIAGKNIANGAGTYQALCMGLDIARRRAGEVNNPSN
jgi:4-hydroxythreonine-4-phosphate dehydrogenase